MNRRPDPLDANERELADLLARDNLSGPSPQLDARILAAARDASNRAAPLRRPRPRWIAGMSIAATLVLAAGIAWRMRPLPPQRPMASEAPMAAAHVFEPAKPTASPPSVAANAAQPQALPKMARVDATPPPSGVRESASTAPARKPPPIEPPVVFDELSPMDTQAPPPAPPPPAPAAAPAPMANGMAAPAASNMQAAQNQADKYDEAKSLDRVEITGSRMKATAGPPAPQAFSREASGVDAAAAANAAAAEGVSRAELDEEPPATADSPRVQEAWLQRIRELLSAGQPEAARNSLAEFRHRYPNYPLPEDLQQLAKP